MSSPLTALNRAARQLRRAPRTLPSTSRLTPFKAASLSTSPSITLRAPHAHHFSSSAARAGSHVPPRGDYKKLTAADVAVFRSFLSSPSSIITTIESPDGAWAASTTDDLVAYNQDWMQKYSGNSPILLKPKTTEEVSKIMKYCYEERIAVVPQGGNTGLVGGSTPVYDELILSTEGMKEIRHFDEVSGEQASSRVGRASALMQFLRYPHLGRRSDPRGSFQLPSSQGLHDASRSRCEGFVPYRRQPLDERWRTSAAALWESTWDGAGNRGCVGGWEGDGAVGWDAWRKGWSAAKGQHRCVLRLFRCWVRSKCLRDSPGYDLKQLFIGAEGTLGIITGVSILTPRLPSVSHFLLRNKDHRSRKLPFQAVNVAVLCVPDFEGVQRVFKETRIALGEILSAFEFFDQEGLDLVLAHTGQKPPFEGEPAGGRAFYVLLETSGSNKDHDDEVSFVSATRQPPKLIFWRS